MRRRDFIAGVGGAGVWSLPTLAQRRPLRESWLSRRGIGKRGSTTYNYSRVSARDLPNRAMLKGEM